MEVSVGRGVTVIESFTRMKVRTEVDVSKYLKGNNKAAFIFSPIITHRVFHHFHWSHIVDYSDQKFGFLRYSAEYIVEIRTFGPINPPTVQNNHFMGGLLGIGLKLPIIPFLTVTKRNFELIGNGYECKSPYQKKN